MLIFLETERLLLRQFIPMTQTCSWSWMAIRA